VNREDNRSLALAVLAAAGLLLIVVGSILSVTWDGSQVQFDNKDLGFAIFTSWGPTLIIVGVLMFASMLGGVFIAQEEKE
jgi:NADH:ubiquinone oxidoreductase subunit 6 (subunit J)